MAFILEDIETEQQTQPTQSTAEDKEKVYEKTQQQDSSQYEGSFLKGLPKAAGKMIAIPAARALELFGSIPGEAIELPSNLTKLGYSAFGQEAPEWTQHPAAGRLSQEGKPYELLKTAEERREDTKKNYGEYTEPTNAAENVLSDLSTIFSGFMSGGIKNPESLAKATAVTYGSRKAMESSGVHPAISGILEPIIAGATIAKTHPQNSIEAATPKGKKLTNIAKLENIQDAPAAIQEAGKRASSAFLRATGKAGEKSRDQAVAFTGQIENAYHDVLSTIYQPYENEHNIDTLRKDTKVLFEPVRNLAQSNPFPLESKIIISRIDKNIAEIKKSRSLSTQESAALTILEKTKRDIQRRGINLDDGVSTYRSYNQHVKDWNSITKNDSHLIDVKKSIEEALLKTGKKVPGFNDAFTFSNAAYTELSNLDHTASIMKSSFDAQGNFDLDKFHAVVLNKENAKLLTKTMGAQSYNRLKNIAELSKEASKNFHAVDAMLPDNLRSANKAISILGGLTKPLIATGEFITSNILAKILLKPNLERNYIGYLKSLKEKSPRVAAYYLQKINDDLRDETSEEGGYILED